MSGVLVAAFTLSVVHTIYAWVAGIEDPTFTVDTPLAWGFYAVAFGMAALARRTERWAQLTVLAYLATVLGIAFFYYPTTFGLAAADGVRLVRERRLRRAARHGDLPRGAAAAAHDAHAGVTRGWALGLGSLLAVGEGDALLVGVHEVDDALEDLEHGRRQLLGREVEVGQLGPLRNIPDEPTQASLVAVGELVVLEHCA